MASTVRISTHFLMRPFSKVCPCCVCVQASDQYLLDGLKRLCEAALAEVRHKGLLCDLASTDAHVCCARAVACGV
jgi:hypothetical protein